MKGDTSAAIDFLKHWSPEGPWILTAIHPEGGKISTVTFAAEDEISVNRWLEERQGKFNLYFMVNPVMNSVASKPKKTDMLGMSALHVDVDPRAGEDFEEERIRAEKLLKEFSPAPTVIIDSGGGFQGFWKLDQLYSTNGNEERATELEAYNQQIEVLLQADACHNIDRIMRLPGTINIPGARKKKKGRVAALAQVVEANWDRIYELENFTAAPRVQTPSGSGPEVKISGNLEVVDLDRLPEKVTDKVKAMIVNGDDADDPTRYGSRSEALWGVICELVRAGCEDDQIAGIILDPDYGISGHVLDQSRPQQYAARQIQRAREEAIDPWLRKLNEDHAVIEDIGGKCRVISEVMDYVLDRSRITKQSFEDFRNRYMHIGVVVGADKEGKEVKMPLGKWWLQNPNRRQYRTIVFAPGREVKDAYNLWRGFSCEARPGDCSKLITHIHENVCSGNAEYSDYLINWMAHAVQKPDSPGQVAVVMRGRMGVGKGFLVKAFGSLWGRHYLQISDPKHIVGSFNSHLRDCVVLFGDEAFYAGDKKHESILKTMVTEEMLMFESKGVDAEPSPNYIHLMMASNSDWVWPAGLDERRGFILDVGDKQLQNKSYFRALQTELDNGGREAFLHMLMTRDLSQFEVRDFPKTDALQEQKLMSMDPSEQWWFNKLLDGELYDGQWNGPVTKADIHRDYLTFMENLKVPRRMSPPALGKFLKRVLPGSFPKAFQKHARVESMDRYGHTQETNKRVWFYEFPSLEEARERWDSHFGGPYEWPK